MEEHHVVDALRCVILLEEAVADLYDRLARLVKIVECSAALAFVARESSNHAALLKSLYGEPLSEKCPQILGTAGTTTLSRIREVAAKLDAGWTPSHRQVAELLEELNDVERLVGEEVYTQIAAAVLSTRFSRLQEELLMSIAEEEKRHYEIVRIVAEELKKQ
ncbi:MAG: hypothetical protein QXO64_07895 [Thermofilaceae archaeon]